SFYEREWNPTTYAYQVNTNSNSNSSVTGLDWMNQIMDGSSFYEREWNPTTYAYQVNANSNSNSYVTWLDWNSEADLSESHEEIAPGVQNYKKKSSRKVHRDANRPKVSYSILAALAIESSATGELAVPEIYKFICDQYPYYRTAPEGWKNSLRHCLSHSNFFHQDELQPVLEKSGLWSIRPEKQAKIDANIAKWRKKQYSEETEAIDAEVVSLVGVKSNKKRKADLQEKSEGPKAKRSDGRMRVEKSFLNADSFVYEELIEKDSDDEPGPSGFY
ncbi:hypothetical protein PENTCL1PPCAC_5605, partial [Pristionchus entomophagus]